MVPFFLTSIWWPGISTSRDICKIFKDTKEVRRCSTASGLFLRFIVITGLNDLKMIYFHYMVLRGANMKVRVYDRTTDTYFKSEVYAIINTGWYEKFLVLVPSEKGPVLKLYDYFDKSNKKSHPVLVNVIIPSQPSDWVFWKSESVDDILAQFKGLLRQDIKFYNFWGCSSVFNDKKAMISLLNNESIPLAGSILDFEMPTSNLDGWDYVETQNDVNLLMEQVFGLHDSILKQLNYISGGYVAPNGSMAVSDDIRQVTMIFDSQWCNSIELVFEGVTALNLRPAADNQSANLFDASVHVKDASVFFCDCYLEKEDTSYTGTWIKAFSLRWRFI
jgi:hypothetical protein